MLFLGFNRVVDGWSLLKNDIHTRLRTVHHLGWMGGGVCYF